MPQKVFMKLQNLKITKQLTIIGGLENNNDNFI